MGDLRNVILRSAEGKRFTASIIADDAGIVVGTTAVKEESEKLGLSLERLINEGSDVRKGGEIVRFCGNAKQIVMAEEVLMGLIAKPSGIATAARKAVERTGGKPKIVCGAWKKMPWVLKNMIRQAIVAGGALERISSDPFIYLDKNYVKLLGGIKESLRAVAELKDYLKVVQLKGGYKNIALEACEAAQSGAHILFVDTGRASDLQLVIRELLEVGLRSKVSIAFGGGVRIEHIDELKALDVDILDIGREIVDAPLLDMRLELVDTEARREDI
jgi:nicotinate-nucleotide pyrophosphorylase (carboxylating)